MVWNLLLLLEATFSVGACFWRLKSVDFGVSGITCPPKLGDFYYIIENFGRVCEIFGSMTPIV